MSGEGNIEIPVPARFAVACLVFALMVVAIALVPQAERAGAAGGTSECKHAESAIDGAKAKQLARAVRCVINEYREANGRDRLRWDRDLARASKQHNKAMFATDCWRHSCPGERKLGPRLRASGYLDGARRWRFAQVFGCDATPADMLATWLGFDDARKKLRKRWPEEIGVGAKKGQVGASGCAAGDEVTYTAVLAKRRP